MYSVLNSDHSMEEWLKLQEEVKEALKHATEDDAQGFADSGAGEMLDMTCSAIRRIQDQN